MLSLAVYLSLLGTAAGSCNTASCNADDVTSLMQLKKGFPTIPVVPVILPSFQSVPVILPAEAPVSLLQRSASATVQAQAQQQSLALSGKFAELAKAIVGDSSVTKQLLQTFKVCGQCGSFARWGEADDGGYLMCMDGLKKGSVMAAYSLGVEHHDQWSEDVASNLGVKVHQFDCTVDGSATCSTCQFHKKCIVAADGKHPVPGHETEGWSLEQALAETGHANAPDNSLLMKMDIEGSEWAVYAAEPPETLKKFGELIMEFHNLENEKRHPEYLQAMTHLLAAGFKVAHLHGNNNSNMYSTGATTIPNVLEVTFVHGDARPDGCLADQDYNTLDAPNTNSHARVELPMAHIEAA